MERINTLQIETKMEDNNETSEEHELVRNTCHRYSEYEYFGFTFDSTDSNCTYSADMKQPEIAF